MPQGGLRVLVQLQFDDVETGVCQHHDVYPALRRVYLHVHHISRKEREDDEEHLLVMALMVGHVAVRHGAEEGLEQAQGPVHVVVAYQHRHLGDGDIAILGEHALQIVWQETLEEAHLYLLVGEVESVKLTKLIVSLNGKVSALIQ